MSTLAIVAIAWSSLAMLGLAFTAALGRAAARGDDSEQLAAAGDKPSDAAASGIPALRSVPQSVQPPRAARSL